MHYCMLWSTVWATLCGCLHTYLWLSTIWYERLWQLVLLQFLDASQPWAPFAYLGLFAVHWVFFGFVILLLQIKYWILQYFQTSRQQLEVQMAKVKWTEICKFIEHHSYHAAESHPTQCTCRGCTSINQSINQSINRSINQSICKMSWGPTGTQQTKSSVKWSHTVKICFLHASIS